MVSLKSVTPEQRARIKKEARTFVLRKLKRDTKSINKKIAFHKRRAKKFGRKAEKSSKKGLRRARSLDF